MSVGAFIDELADVGIRLGRDGDDLIVDVLPGATLDPYRERIRDHKPALLKEVLQRSIVEAATVEPDLFDRPAYDALWVRWHAQDAMEQSTP